MVYVGTSVLVALHLNESRSADVARWYASCADELISAMWCVTEFASALDIKQRTGQISEDDAGAAWRRFERLCANDLHLLPVEPASFHRAAVLTLDAATWLRAGDSLHLAVALEAKAKSMATLDEVLGRNAKRMKLKMAVRGIGGLAGGWKNSHRAAPARPPMHALHYRNEFDVRNLKNQGATKCK